MDDRSGFDEVTGALTAVRRIDPLAFVGGLAYSTSFEKNGVKPSDQITLSLGTVLATSPDTSLLLLFQQSFAGDTEVDGRDLPGTDQEAAILTIGGSLLSPRVLLDISTGIGLTGDASDYFIRAVLPIRFDLSEF